MTDTFEIDVEYKDAFDLYTGEIYYVAENEWEDVDMTEIYIKELIEGIYDFDKDNIFDFIKTSLFDLFKYYKYKTLIMILESEYWRVFEPDEEWGWLLVREYCFKEYSHTHGRNEFMELLCQRIDFSNSLHLIERCLNMRPRKRTYSEMECGYKILDYSNVNIEKWYIKVDEYFYNFIKNKYYTPPIVNYPNKRKC